MEQATTNSDVEIVYEAIGPNDGEPLLLVMGAGLSMISWPEGFVHELVSGGFQVARFDNRDAGRSTHLGGVSPPSLLKILLSTRSGGGERTQGLVPYGLDDMANDAIAVLDGLGWPSAHLLGMSLGAAIAQTVAANHPDRVKTLTSISSAPLDYKQARFSLKAARAMAKVNKRVTSAEGAERIAVGLMKLIGTPGRPSDEEGVRLAARAEYERSYDRAGGRRQGAALMALGKSPADHSSDFRPDPSRPRSL